jgi:hypothetical protein
MKLFKSAEEKQELAGAESAFTQFIGALGDAEPSTALALVDQFKSNPQIAVLGGKARRKLGKAAFSSYAESVLADDHLTADEEDAFAAVAEAMGLTQEDLEAQSDLYVRLQIAALNDGRLPVVDNPQHLIPKKGEIVHFETAAALMKEVAVREWRGGSSGVSFRVAKGVRYHVGSTRGHMVTVGTQLQMADSGVLAVTSKRVAYLGSRKTVDMPFAKIMGLELYTDAVQFSLSNRQNAPLIRVTVNTDVLGALLNGAIQAADE